jgi:hypothetical protein
MRMAGPAFLRQCQAFSHTTPQNPGNRFALVPNPDGGELTFEELLNELLALIDRWIGVAVYGTGDGVGPLAGFIGRLDAGVPYEDGDRLAFRVMGGDPDDGRANFYLSPDAYRAAHWRELPTGERELLIAVEGGAFGLTLEDG